MFDMGWWEISIVGLMMILVLGPKELPQAMRTIARFMRKAKRLAGEFQGHMDDLVREADLDDVKRTVSSIQNKDVGSMIGQAVDPTGELTRDIDTALADARQEVQDIKSAAGPSPTATGVTTPPKIAPKPEMPEPNAELTKAEAAKPQVEPQSPKAEPQSPKAEPQTPKAEPVQENPAAAGNA
ncbi:MAG: twin-arginine translocase subunit TatB [Alphaproteobacteria bacterium]|nr:twin-arginine translocase subunit TatB [Alphaproteobacteria bacterium]